jgi:DNA polymerase III delta prime subunit
MVRFRLYNNDNDGNSSVAADPMDAMTEYGRRQEDNVPVQFAEDSLPADAPAFIVAYQRNGTPFLVPYNPPKQPRTLSWSFWLVLVAVVTQLVLWYGPPAPPTANEAWHEFFRRETGAFLQSTTNLLSVIPHVSHWISKELHAEITELIKSPPCPMELPTNLEILDARIVGQSRAVTITKQALHAWTRDKNALILLLSGTVGVGKLQLAQLVATLAVCQTSTITIHGRDYAHRHDLVSQLRRHISGGGGRVVIIQHPEDMMQHVLFMALESLASSPNLIIIITTHLGSRIIHRHLKDEGSSPTFSLESALRHELDTELGTGVSDYVTAIAPFVPLGSEELQQILIQKTALELNLTMTTELAQHWTSPRHVEYLEWTSQGRTIQTFSTRGAKALEEEIWRRLVTQLHECGGAAAGGNHQLDWDDGQAVLRVCLTKECREVCRFSLTLY